MFKQATGGAVTTLLAAFLAGGLVAWGVSAALRGAHRGEWRGIGAPGPGRPGGPGSPEGRRVLARELGLSPTQEDSVQAVFERHRPQMEALWREMRPRFDSLRATVDSEIALQLIPAQRARFAELTKRFDARHHGESNPERR
jgi:Spy/CpxP family protein refolding chaperone